MLLIYLSDCSDNQMIRLHAKIPGIQPGMTTMARSGHRPNTRLFFLASSPCELIWYASTAQDEFRYRYSFKDRKSFLELVLSSTVTMRNASVDSGDSNLIIIGRDKV